MEWVISYVEVDGASTRWLVAHFEAPQAHNNNQQEQFLKKIKYVKI